MYSKTELDSGLRVLTIHAPHAYSVSVAIFIGTGSRYESEEMAGASHFIEHLLFKGTRGMPTARQLSEAVESVGGLINGSTGRESTTLWCKVARHHFRLALRVLSDMVRWPLLDSDEMEKERGVILEEIRMTNDYPSYRVGALIDTVLWPDQPLGREVTGTLKSVSTLTREQLLVHYRRQYTPVNTVVSVAGDIGHDEVVEEVGRALKGWGPQEPLPWYPFRDSARGERLAADRRETDQVHVCIGLPALARAHPDRWALDMMNAALGEGMSSRLFSELRERQGLAYEVQSAVSHLQDCGSLVVYCGVEPSKALQAAEIVIGELERLKEGLSPSELEKVKSMTRGQLLLRMENTSSLATWGGAQELLQNRVMTLDEVLDEIAAVKEEDIRRVANELISRQKLRMALVGPFTDEASFQALLDS